MADTASLKEILFRHSAEQCKVCEAIPFEAVGHQIEYEKFKMLHEVIEDADLEDEYQEWRRVYGYVQEGGEDMNEIATVMNEEEFGYFLKSFEKKADLKSLSMISRRCQVVDTLCGLQSDTVLTVGQIKQLFELAK